MERSIDTSRKKRLF